MIGFILDFAILNNYSPTLVVTAYTFFWLAVLWWFIREDWGKK